MKIDMKTRLIEKNNLKNNPINNRNCKGHNINVKIVKFKQTHKIKIKKYFR